MQGVGGEVVKKMVTYRGGEKYLQTGGEKEETREKGAMKEQIWELWR